MARSVRLYPVLAVSLALAAGCSQAASLADGFGGNQDSGGGASGVIGRACTAHVDCEGQAACLGGVCARECERATDCPDPSYTCWGFRCLPGDDGGPTDTAQPPGDECTAWSDCTPQPRGCSNGWCVAPQCYSDDECDDADRPDCVFYVCGRRPASTDTVQPADTADDGGPARCTTWDDCPATAGPEGCRDGRCVPAECTADAECEDLAHLRCTNFLCVPRVVEPDVVEPTDVPEDASAPELGYGEACARGSDCETGLCLFNKMTGGATCTKLCEETQDCPQPDWCGEVSDTLVCIANDSGVACTGGACLAGRSFGEGAACFCTTPCPTAAWCPADFACPLDASEQRLCRPIGATCTPSETGDPVCRGQLCYPLDDRATTGVCTVPCASSNDCPAGWACQGENIEGTMIYTCQRVD